MAKHPQQQSTRTQVMLAVYGVHASTLLTILAYFEMRRGEDGITLNETLAAYGITWVAVLILEHIFNRKAERMGSNGECDNGYGFNLLLVFCFIIPVVAIIVFVCEKIFED